jgi:predicted CoA-binding protein
LELTFWSWVAFATAVSLIFAGMKTLVVVLVFMHLRQESVGVRTVAAAERGLGSADQRGHCAGRRRALKNGLMAHQNPSDDELRRILSEAESVAVVGASSSPIRPSHGIFARLLRAGYRVIPVNPNESLVQGQPAYASLRDVAVPVDIVNVFRRPEHTPEVAAEAVAIGAKVLWLQSGIWNEGAAKRAAEGGPHRGHGRVHRRCALAPAHRAPTGWSVSRRYAYPADLAHYVQRALAACGEKRGKEGGKKGKREEKGEKRRGGGKAVGGGGEGKGGEKEKKEKKKKKRKEKGKGGEERESSSGLASWTRR